MRLAWLNHDLNMEFCSFSRIANKISQVCRVAPLVLGALWSRALKRNIDRWLGLWYRENCRGESGNEESANVG